MCDGVLDILLACIYTQIGMRNEVLQNTMNERGNVVVLNINIDSIFINKYQIQSKSIKSMKILNLS